MANVDRVNGFSVLKADPNKFGVFKVKSDYATAIAIGDVVERTGTTDSDGIPYVQQAAAGNVDSLGIVTGFYPQDENNNFAYTAVRYIPATKSGDVSIIVCYDERAELLCQEDSDTSTLAAADVGQLIDHINAGVNTSTGSSGMELDSSTVGATGTFRLHRLYPTPDNAIGANAKWIVTWAEHEAISDAVAV